MVLPQVQVLTGPTVLLVEKLTCYAFCFVCLFIKVGLCRYMLTHGKSMDHWKMHKSGCLLVYKTTPNINSQKVQFCS